MDVTYKLFFDKIEISTSRFWVKQLLCVSQLSLTTTKYSTIVNLKIGDLYIGSETPIAFRLCSFGLVALGLGQYSASWQEGIVEEVTHLAATRKNKGMGRTGSKYLSKGVLWMTQIPSRPLKTFRNLKTPTLSTVFYIATSWWPSLQCMDFLETFNTQTVEISMMWVSYDPVALLRL